jgi:hypothetical protein
MSLIHHTTLKPTKLELLAEWLPTRPWYRGGAGQPSLTKVGGFRLDDPAELADGTRARAVFAAASYEPVA